MNENIAGLPNSTEGRARTSSPQKDKLLGEFVHLEDTKTSSTSHGFSPAAETQIPSLQLKGRESFKLPPNPRMQACQPLEQILHNDKHGVVKLAVKKPSVPVNDVVILSDDEGEESNLTDPGKLKPVSGKHVAAAEQRGSPANCITDPLQETPVSNAAVVGEENTSLLPESARSLASSSSECTKDESNRDTRIVHGSSEKDLLSEGFSVIKETGECSLANAVSTLQSPQQCGCNKQNNEDSQKTIIKDADSRLADNVQTVSGSPSSMQNNLDKYFRQKGPRIAKVIRRINCNVEPLEYGVVQSGKCWSDNRSIYPKGMMCVAI